MINPHICCICVSSSSLLSVLNLEVECMTKWSFCNSAIVTPPHIHRRMLVVASCVVVPLGTEFSISSILPVTLLWLPAVALIWRSWEGTVMRMKWASLQPLPPITWMWLELPGKPCTCMTALWPGCVILYRAGVEGVVIIEEQQQYPGKV